MILEPHWSDLKIVQNVKNDVLVDVVQGDENLKAKIVLFCLLRHCSYLHASQYVCKAIIKKIICGTVKVFHYFEAYEVRTA